MEGGIFENMWDPYSIAYGYPRRARNHRPRAPAHDHYGPSMEPEDWSPYQAEEPVQKGNSGKAKSPKGKPVHPGKSVQGKSVHEKSVKGKSVKEISVTDGGTQAAPPPAPPVPVTSQEVLKVPRLKSEDAAATKIHAVYRGYAVRRTQPLKQLREIKKVREELESFKRKLEDPEQKQKICSDKERLRWTENIMLLLLRLDGLQGMHPDVRLIRKDLTKEIIRFQKTIDSLPFESNTESNGKRDVVKGKNTDVAKEMADAVAPEVLKEMDTQASTPEELRGSVDQDSKATENSTSEKHEAQVHSDTDSIVTQVINSIVTHCYELGNMKVEHPFDL